MNKYRRGKLAPKADTRTLKFKDYFGKLPPIPSAVDWTGKVSDWGMDANDLYGCCAFASMAHCEMLWTSQASSLVVPTVDDVLNAYSVVTGFDRTKPETDQGACLVDVLNFWRQTGIAGRKILAYMQVDHTNLDHVRAAIALFGCVYAGIQVPDDAEDAFEAGQPWVDTSQPASDGHAIPLVAFDPSMLTCVTWGRGQRMTNAWAHRYLDETYCVLTQDWLDAHGVAPSGFNLAQLQQDLKLVSG